MNSLKPLLYFSIFKYPLIEKEIINFSQHKTDSVEEELKELIRLEKIFKIKEYYLPTNNPEWVDRRIKGNKMAISKLKKAKKMARVLSHFPFIRSIMVSGPLAKGYMDEQDDIDFFVIMKPGNITISKMLIGSFRRLFAPKSFCVNFLIDSENLCIKKQNIYTATEMVTLIPVIDDDLYNIFMKVNLPWIKNIFPNVEIKQNKASQLGKSRIRQILEFLLSLGWANQLDEYLRKLYLSKLSKGKKIYEESLKSGELEIHKGVFKGHNLSYEKKIISIYKENLETSFKKNRWEPKQFFYD